MEACFRAHRRPGRQQPHRKGGSDDWDCSKETECSGIFVSRMALDLRRAINSFSVLLLLLSKGKS